MSSVVTVSSGARSANGGPRRRRGSVGPPRRVGSVSTPGFCATSPRRWATRPATSSTPRSARSGSTRTRAAPCPDALADLADSPERTGQVVDLLRLDQDPRGPVEWRQVVNQNRSESGLGVAEVLSAFPKDTGNLRDAVLSDYRSEADATYRGVDQSDELRWDGPS